MAEAGCGGPAAYRPRRARDSPLYRFAGTHHETFKQIYDERFAKHYGPWRGVVERTLFAFLDCGIEERGLARARRAANLEPGGYSGSARTAYARCASAIPFSACSPRSPNPTPADVRARSATVRA